QASDNRSEQLGDVRRANGLLVVAAELDRVDRSPGAADLVRVGAELRIARRIDDVVRAAITAFESQFLEDRTIGRDRNDQLGERILGSVTTFKGTDGATGAS